MFANIQVQLVRLSTKGRTGTFPRLIGENSDPSNLDNFRDLFTNRKLVDSASKAVKPSISFQFKPLKNKPLTLSITDVYD